MRRTFNLLAVVLVIGAVAAGTAIAASSPSVSTGSVSSVTTSSAVLHGSVNPNGSSTTYYFEWGLTPSFGIVGHTRSVGGGTKTVSVQATATGLIPGTKYYYRVVATNGDGTAAGKPRSFTTGGHPPPAVATGPATSIMRNGATVTGAVNPNGEATTYTFQYGTTPSYGVETTPRTLPAGSTTQAVSATLTGLEPGTIFYYRLVGLHGTSVVQYGAGGAFMTYPSPRPVPRVRALTTPRRSPKLPHVFTTVGSVSRPGYIPASLGCVGNGTLRFFFGRHQVAFSLVPLNPNCTFSARTGFGRVRHPVRLRVFFHFRGNGYLAPSNAPAETVVVG